MAGRPQARPAIDMHCKLVNERHILPELSSAQFDHIRQLLYRECGINLQAGKEALVKSRLTKRLRLLGMKSFSEYIRFLEKEEAAEERSDMIDALTTNLTHFFREPRHFEYLCSRILPQLVSRRDRIRFWSAGCSSGEEPYSLAIVLREHLPDVERRDCRILATDISAPVLARAREAVYGEETLRDVSPELLRRYFERVQAHRAPTYRVTDNVKAMVHPARLNLMEEWPMAGPFDVIFCRNVMIYFDTATRRDLVRRFWEKLRPGGHLFIGHSESLTNSSREFRFVQPAIYVK